jgi:UDP-N-acetylmuramoylalanine--D-glutamate ligase
VRFRLGGHHPDDFDAADVIVVNPAVPFDHPLVERARDRGTEIVTEIGLTLRELQGPVVAVTGTNGKSTTASLCAAMLRASGVPAALGGNIGRSLLNEAARLDRETVTVLELSSFQLAWLEHDMFSPVAGIVTNVSGDHFDRHPTFEHYVAAKLQLVEAVGADGIVVLNRHDEVCRAFAARARGGVVWFGDPADEPVALDRLGLAGRHNRANAAAAAHAALATGATPAGCAKAAGTFRPLPHRLEPLGDRGGVRFIDDSVATTPVATAAAVEACGGSVILLAGGRDKGLDWKPLIEAAGRAKELIAYGETGPQLRDAVPRAHLERNLDGAVRRALDLARPGDVVLLSPGFASYDEFPGFDARGARFRRLVAGDETEESGPSPRSPS